MHATDSWQDDADDSRPPLSREQAQLLLAAKPGVSVWRVVALQALVALLVAAAAWPLGGAAAALSALWGGAIVMLPAALFAGGMRRWLINLPPAYALFGFAFGELLKIALTIVLLVLAPRVLGRQLLLWPALLAGLVVTLQVYWVALLLRGRRKR